jgi:hypothetical protein
MLLILTSKDEYTNINTTKKVIAAPENGDNIYNHCNWYASLPKVIGTVIGW